MAQFRSTNPPRTDVINRPDGEIRQNEQDRQVQMYGPNEPGVSIDLIDGSTGLHRKRRLVDFSDIN